ncbi:glycoside hydrolase family 43 protein [Cellulomonas fimi]|uniref:Family 43 glycosylhydrolase n=1 Tax=Cellulomonas fimi TaxID=1708 RepID=A0A7Y0QHE6_CELFI|nr:glycoside hydrolase family 43 protein [Cellulomonas fimi]NMR20205.1 family 43 glycosylhydrolase [Cellulomonas fimi]
MRAPGAQALAVSLVLALAACGTGDDAGSATDDAGSPAPSSAPGATSSGTAGDGAGGDNPVLADDFPDPDVLEVDGTYYAYATNGNSRNVRVARSDDLVEWEELDDALPRLPAYVVPGKTWAPEVTRLAPDRYVLYYTATSFRPALQCIGVAVASAPEGPFEPVGDAMLVCPPEEGGAIDASTFLDADGTQYLLWKNDGNCCGLDTWLQLAPLTADGLALAGPPVRLVTQDQPWEGNLVEAPTLVERDGSYVLLYSANDYGGSAYAIGYATAPAVTGPYTKDPEPLLTTYRDAEYVGPGGQDVVVGPDGEDRLVFHSWYGQNTYRAMNVLPLDWQDGRPVVEVD